VSAVAGVLYGIKPAVTAIVLFAAYRIGSRALSNNILKVLAVCIVINQCWTVTAFTLVMMLAHLKSIG
jgi:chromate transporter